MFEHIASILFGVFGTVITRRLLIKSIKNYSFKYKKEVYYVEFIRALFISVYLMILLFYFQFNTDLVKKIGYISFFVVSLLIFLIDLNPRIKLLQFIRKTKRKKLQSLILVVINVPYAILVYILFSGYLGIEVEQQTARIAYIIIGTIFYLLYVPYMLNILERFYHISKVIEVIFNSPEEENSIYDDIYENKEEYILFKKKIDEFANIATYETVIISKQLVKKIIIEDKTKLM